MQAQKSLTASTIGIAALTGGIFILDLLTPLGTVEWVLYAIPVLLASRLPQRLAIQALTAASIALIILGWLYSPPGISPGLSLVNRGLGIGVLCVTAMLLLGRRRVEDRLQETTEALRAVFQASPLAIVSLDPEGRLTMWNPAAERIFGWREPEVLGQPLPFVPEAKQEEFTTLRERVLRGEMLAGVELRRQRRDGTPIDVSLWAGPLHDARGEIVGIIGIVADITERRREEERIRLQSAALESAANAIVITDREGRILWANPAFTRLTGYSGEEAIGQTPRFLKSGQHAPAFYEHLWATILAGEVWHGETINRRKDGSLYTEEQTITPVRDARGEISHFIAIKQDITAQRQAEQALITRTRQLEAVRAVSAEVTRELDLPTLLGLIHRRAAELVGTASGAVLLWDEAAQVLVPQAWHGIGDWFKEMRLRLGEGIAGRVAERRVGMIVNDYRSWPHAVAFTLERSGITAIIAEPLLYRDRLLGVITSNAEQSKGSFTEHDRELLALFATQAAIAIENARLYDATVRQLGELRALHDTGLAITSSLTLDEQLEILVQRLGQAAQAQRILVALLDPKDPARFHQCLAHDSTRADPWLRHLDLSSGRYPEIQEAVRTGRQMVIPDVPAEARLDAIRDHLKHLDLRSLIVVPLVVRERAIGAVSLGYVGQGRTFTDQEVNLLRSFAAQAAIAIEKARLYQEIQHHAAELEQRVQERTRELEAANEQLQVASRHKSEFLANMSHELRTPLNSIIGFAELVGEQRVGPLNEKQARYLGHIHTSGQHLLRLISDILDLSKVEAGKFALQPEPLLVAATLEDILVIARGLANKKQQELSVEIEANLPPLRADPVRFKQILFNLLSNAVKFTPEGGTIAVRARRVPGIADFKLQIADLKDEGPPLQSAIENLQSEILGDFLEIAVTDTGIGIKADDLPRLFHEFVQLEASATKRHEGTGLGLALTKRLVEMHGGRIWAESEGEGRGSTFTVVLSFGGPGDLPEASDGGPSQ